MWCCACSYISFRGANLLVAADARTQLVYVRDLLFEVPDEPVKVFLCGYGVVHSLTPHDQAYPYISDVLNGTRVAKDLPSSVRIAGYDVRFWYQGQPHDFPGAARLVIAFMTVLLMVSDILAVSLGMRLASVPPANRLLLPLPLIPFLLFLHATVSVSVSGADPSMSADEEKNDPDFFDLSASESGYCSGDNEYSVLFPLLSWFPVAGSVLLRLHLLRLLVWLSSLLLGPPSIPKTTSLMSCRVNLILLLPLGLRSCCCKVRFCICKVFCYKVRYFLLPLVFSCFWKAGSFTAKSSGCLSTNWGISGRSGSGYVVFECPDSQVFWDFGSLSRSIEEVDSISFEYTIVSWIMVVVRFRGRKRLLCCVSLLYLKMLLTPCLLVCLPSSLDNNLSLSSTDPLLMYSTSSCCISVFVASYFASYCLLVGEVRHLGELGGLVPPSIPVCCLWCVLWLFLVAIALIPPGGGHSP